jgi:hypothetical protein
MGKVFGPIVVSIVLTPVLLFLAVASGGGGHGDYLFAKVLFPYTVVLWLQGGDALGAPSEVLACVQMPVYAAVGGLAWRRGWHIPCLIVLAIVHGIAVWLAFEKWRQVDALWHG